MSAFQTAPRHASRFSARGLLDRLVKVDVHYRRRYELRHLNDHMLRDIGVSRADVDAELRGSFLG